MSNKETIFRLTRTIVYEGPLGWIDKCLRVDCNRIPLGGDRRISETRTTPELVEAPDDK
jgi:hypothetical protein